ncbi:hypothetical protein DAEQUDRAFT_729247 [Daedalea quercina L-15889]|uniref:Uncharacterized protein n=1 Tax=Daedalea quercina L-15889 TaxID=1314783 RepID=A0A165NPN2_9APHY|nr:hypothetical protein DAEQUDRAFT_729247 [Daedalea quercina L-15889]
MVAIASTYPGTRRRKCLCGNWFSVRPEQDRYCSKPCALADSWNTLVAGESHYRREMAAREAARGSTKRVTPIRAVWAPDTSTFSGGQYSGSAAQAQYYPAPQQARSHHVQSGNQTHVRAGTRSLRRMQSTMHLLSLARSQPVHPVGTMSSASFHYVSR